MKNKLVCLSVIFSLLIVMLPISEPTCALSSSNTTWITEYNHILSEGYVGHNDGYISKEDISDSGTVFALAYINDDDIPELFVAPRGWYGVIFTIDGSVPKVIRRGLYYDQYESFGYYERNDYISAYLPPVDSVESEFWENLFIDGNSSEPSFFKRDCYLYDPDESLYFGTPVPDTETAPIYYYSEEEFYKIINTNIDKNTYKPFEVYKNTGENRKKLLSIQDAHEPESNIYNLGDETYSFENYSDTDSNGHCFGMSMTSAGYYQNLLDRSSIIGGNRSNSLYSFNETAKIKKPICHYQAIQGSYEKDSMVAGGKKDLQGYFDIEYDWNDVINYVKSHEYDNNGTLQVGYWGKDAENEEYGGHAVNFLYYKEVNRQQRLYIYDNNFPYEESYLYKDNSGKIRQAPYATFSYSINGIDLVDVAKYFSKAATYDASHCIYSKTGKIKILCDDVIVSQMKCNQDRGGLSMYELPDYIEKVTIVPTSDDASFTYMNKEYSFGDIDDNTYGELYLDDSGNNTSNFSVIKNQGRFDTQLNAYLSKTRYAFTGKKIKPHVIVLTGDGNYLDEGRDYTVKYYNNKYLGEASAFVEGIGEYQGFADSLYFKIYLKKPAKGKIKKVKVLKKKKKVKVYFKKLKYATSYRIYVWSNKKDLMIYDTKKTFITTGKLKKGKRYHIKVRGVEDFGDGWCTGKWSKEKTVRIK